MYSSKTVKERWGVNLKANKHRKITLLNRKGTVQIHRYSYQTIEEVVAKSKTQAEANKCGRELREDLYYYRDKIKSMGKNILLPEEFLCGMLDLDLDNFEEIFRGSCVKPQLYDYRKVLETVDNCKHRKNNSVKIEKLESIFKELSRGAKDDYHRVRIGSAIIKMVEKTFNIKNKKSAYESIGENLMEFEKGKEKPQVLDTLVQEIKQDNAKKWYHRFTL